MSQLWGRPVKHISSDTNILYIKAGCLGNTCTYIFLLIIISTYKFGGISHQFWK